MNQYNTDIEMVMDFMKLSLIFDDDIVSHKERADILKLQRVLVELLPVAQSNRMSACYDILRKIYHKNKYEFMNPVKKIPDKRNDHYILLFYKSTCPASRHIMGDWEEFKRQHMDSNFTIIEYDSMDPKNADVFAYFKVDSVPTLFKLRLDQSDYIQKMSSNISPHTLNDFAKF